MQAGGKVHESKDEVGFLTSLISAISQLSKLIKEVLALAMRSPSSMNTQPWNFTVVSGEPLNRIRAGNTERNLAGVPHSREFRIGGAFAGEHRDRQVGARIGCCAVSASLMPLFV